MIMNSFRAGALGLVVVASMIEAVRGFAVLPMMARHPGRSTPKLFLYVDEYSTPPNGAPPPTEMERRVQDCLNGASNTDVTVTMALLQELEEIQNACTEEGNQTDEECDIVQKANRDYWIKALEDSLHQEEEPSSSSSSSTKLEEQVVKCLNSNKKFSPHQIRSMIEQLEEMNAECTEDSNQTNEECDVSVKFQRDDWIQQLEAMIEEEEQPTTIESSPPQESSLLSTASLSELMSLLEDLEQKTNACTEEGNQTDDECDIAAVEDRFELMELVSKEILQKQTHTTNATKLCMQYNVCETSRLRQTLADLETLNNLCTEEGNQTRTFCSLQAKEERETIMEKLRTQLELADNVVKAGDRSVFQI